MYIAQICCSSKHIAKWLTVLFCHFVFFCCGWHCDGEHAAIALKCIRYSPRLRSLVLVSALKNLSTFEPLNRFWQPNMQSKIECERSSARTQSIELTPEEVNMVDVRWQPKQPLNTNISIVKYARDCDRLSSIVQSMIEWDCFWVCTCVCVCVDCQGTHNWHTECYVFLNKLHDYRDYNDGRPSSVKIDQLFMDDDTQTTQRNTRLLLH